MHCSLIHGSWLQLPGARNDALGHQIFECHSLPTGEYTTTRAREGATRMPTGAQRHGGIYGGKGGRRVVVCPEGKPRRATTILVVGPRPLWLPWAHGQKKYFCQKYFSQKMSKIITFSKNHFGVQLFLLTTRQENGTPLGATSTRLRN